MGSFQRVSTEDLVRGAARLLIADADTVAKPTMLSDVIELTTVGQTNEVQTATITGTPTGGSFLPQFKGATGGAVANDADGAALQAVLEAMSTIGTGNVTVAGAAGGPYTITFQNALGYQDVPLLTFDDSGLTGGTSPAIAAVETTPGTGQYDPKPGWGDLGGTREGIQITVNNAEDSFDIDQIAGDIGAAPSSWECSVATRLAEMTLERMQLVWEGSDITLDTTPTTGDEREIGFAGATNYTKRRLAVLFQKPDGKIRGYLFHKVVRSPQESTIDHRKGGDAMTIPASFRALADETEVDPKKQFFIIRDQV